MAKTQNKSKLLVQNMVASTDEYAFSLLLDKWGIDYQFQPHSIIVIPEFNGQIKRHKDTIYTPDFYFKYQDYEIVIEVKGFMQGDNRIKTKLADQVYTKELGMNYFVLRLTGTKSQGTKGFYDYIVGRKKMVKHPKEQIKQEFFYKLINKTHLFLKTKDKLLNMNQLEEDKNEN